ncbi:Sec-independent protein translocase protein TatB [Thalassomonas actiniarum]|uniref:Sec-independent protein translocase protein TatB n=1 Tax=Thalassomonas actiniarum TaxID=485447 RepID=A0AAE9YSZ5_9GAMM|nr:Sec-independent protein translocase protein TatB [Thalassomonas actiniarum]WDD99026.1 Sec-independent protein translocase subunit TatB [Thalassomonas actiniarum]
MFDVGFWELILIAIIGLVVLGPERLPVAIRTVRSWIAGVRKFSDNVKSELTEELRIQELHENLKKAEQSNLKDLSPEVAESLKSLQDAAKMVTRPYEKSAGDESGQVSSAQDKAPVAQEKLAAASGETPSASLSGASSDVSPDSVSDSASGSSLDSSLDKEKQKP